MKFTLYLIKKAAGFLIFQVKSTDHFYSVEALWVKASLYMLTS